MHVCMQLSGEQDPQGEPQSQSEQDREGDFVKTDINLRLVVK